MPFIKAGNEARSQHCNVGPSQSPLRSRRGGQSLPPGAKQQNAQQAIAEHVSGFSHQDVVRLKCSFLDPKQKMQKRIEKVARILRREIRRRFDSDNDEPQDQSDPGFQNLLAVGPQATREKLSPAFAHWDAQLLAAFAGSWIFDRADRKSGPSKLLFNRIVGSFARDHDIVHMALAQPGAADAHEARFLQQLGNRGAAAIPHAGLQSAHHLINDHRD